MLFLDIGCNIGTYTIAIARLGRSVVAADALTDNLQLLNKSLTMGNLQRHVTLIWNAVSDILGTMTFVVPRDNVAGTIEKETITTETAFLKTGRRFDVRSIVLDDLIPMLKGKRVLIKMDIEGREYHALKGGEMFFDSVAVPLIQMEWKFHYQNEQEIVNFLSARGFDAVADIDGKTSLVGVNIARWPNDVYFLNERTGQ